MCNRWKASKTESINGDESIDFICTHPPFIAAVPYAEYQKLDLWWLDLANPSILDKP
jgi:hypothetical protein